MSIKGIFSPIVRFSKVMQYARYKFRENWFK